MVYVMDVKFLRHPTPLEYECLESYLHRLANENKVPNKWVLDYLGLKSSLYKSLYEYNNLPFDKIAFATSLSEHTIRNMTALGLLNINPYDYHGIINNSTSKFCPLCLKEQNYPRVYWQYDLLNVCHKHNSILISKCPNCGSYVTVEAIINGKCSCGQELRDVEPIFCVQNDFLNFSKLLYAAHNIIADANGFFYKLTGLQYLEFINSLLSLISKYRNILSLDWLPKQDEFGEYTDLYLQNLLCKILEDWPSRLFQVFDDIYIYSDINIWKKENVFNPIINVAFNCSTLTSRTEFNFASKVFFEYLHSRYNYNYFLIKHRDDLIDNKFLSIKDLYEIFGIFHYEVFDIHKIENNNFINIEDIFKLFHVIFKKTEPTSIVNDTEYIDFHELVKLRPLGLKENIYRYIEQLKQPIHITSYEERGIQMFSFPKP